MFFNNRCLCCQTIIPLLAGFLVNFPVGSLAVAVAVLDLLASGALEKFAGFSAAATNVQRRFGGFDGLLEPVPAFFDLQSD